MKAVYFDQHGEAGVLRHGDLGDPVPGWGEVVLDVRAAALNHLDIFVRRGFPGIKLPLPHVPGCDASGRVAALGEGVTGVVPGERVLIDPLITCGRCEFCVRGDAALCRTFNVVGEHRWGSCAEKLVVPVENVIPIPDNITYETAAAAPLACMTAWRMLITRARLRPGEDILILGAAAGVGVACIQIARRTGARVIAAASSDEKLDLCRKLGADVLINYEEEDFVERVREETGKRGVDIVVDYIGKDTWVRSLRSLARGGRLVTCGATTGYDPNTDLRHVFYRQLEIIGSTLGNRNELMSPLRLVFEGTLEVPIGAVFDLEDTAEGHRLMESRRALGKIVIRVSED